MLGRSVLLENKKLPINAVPKVVAVETLTCYEATAVAEISLFFFQATTPEDKIVTNIKKSKCQDKIVTKFMLINSTKNFYNLFSILSPKYFHLCYDHAHNHMLK